MILGILFAIFGVLSLVNPVFTFGDIVFFAGAVTIAALVRLILICLPGSSTFTGSTGLEIAVGITEALFGLAFILDALIYVEFLYSLIAVLLFVQAIIRIRQCSLAKKQGLSGWGSYLFISILFLAAAAGLLLLEYAVKVDLQYELAGAAAFMYGFFLSFTSFYKTVAEGFAAQESSGPVDEITGEEVTEYPEDLGTRKKLAE